MQVLIIEDEPLAASRLTMLLQEIDMDIQVLAVLDSVEESVDWFRSNQQPDLVLLDIELADGISFSIFSQVELHCPVIFTTAYDQYALEAFKLFSIDYLLKPVNAEALERAVKKYRSFTAYNSITSQIREVIQSIRKPEKQYRNRFLVKTGSRMFFVESCQAAYFVSEGKTVFLLTREGMRFPLDTTLEKLQEDLDPRDFFRLNRSVICSIHAIREIKSYHNSRLKISLLAGSHSDEAVVSRERVSAFKSWADA
jgi:two-component system, LytTR family, response regulator LytT